MRDLIYGPPAVHKLCAFWAQPNAFFSQLFYLCAFWAPKSANKCTLTRERYGGELGKPTFSAAQCSIHFKYKFTLKKQTPLYFPLFQPVKVQCTI